MKITKKIVLVGHFGVGKTSLIRRFVDNEFDTDYQVTIGVQVKKKDVEVDDKTISFLIWDIEGTTSLDNTRKSYLLGSSGFIYVFDLSRPETFENLETELRFLKDHFPNIPVALIGNKEDLVDIKEKKSYFEIKKIQVSNFSSAKTGKGVDQLFFNLAQKMIENES